MTVTNLTKDADRGTMTLTAEFPASVDRVWQLWANPRQLERWWGPPAYPATVTDHDLVAGGEVRYFMTGPDDERYHGGWRIVSAEKPQLIEFEDFFANADGTENTDLPASTIVVSIEDIGDGMTRMTIACIFASPEAMATVLEMGMEEGFREALGQIDGLLAATRARWPCSSSCPAY